ncbi:MAG: outer membrane protein transport protein [Candidatus Krumholzibacteria bacterium]|nr:outer membrane protein transport protein [Candidatus Krumholzibacteria bacterium]
MKSGMVFVLIFILAVMCISVPDAFATNGMNMEGYGPIAHAMGGASFGYWNGTAAMMGNPATLSFLKDDYWVDLALGFLGPDVDATVTTPMGAMEAESLSDAFYMPALGFLMRRGEMTFGLGVFSQGGMGTEFGNDSWMADPSMGQNSALESGLVNRSEVGVGRVIVPFTYDVNEKFSIGASIDFVWAGMDLQMGMSATQFENLANPMAQTIGTISGSMAESFGMMYEPFGGTGIQELHHAYFDFTNDSDFSGEAKGTGFAGKIGAVYNVNPKLTLGATYHSKTILGDLETDNASMSMGVNIDDGVLMGGAPSGNYVDYIMDVSGKITVKDFEWPAMFGIGAALEATDRLMIACDLKMIQWSSVMEDFKLVFEADNVATNGGFAGQELNATLFQNWDDQFVISIGGAFDVTEALVIRAGYNYGKNPVPDKYLNALFPAIVENHITFGAGYYFSENRAVNLSMVTATSAEFENPGDGSDIPPVESTHSQFNWQLMFSTGF